MTAEDARKKLHSLADPAFAASAARFFKKEHTGDDICLGLRAPTLRQLAKEFRALPLTEVESLLQSRVHEERALALLILGLHVHRATEAVRKEVCDFYLANTRHVNNWDLVDISAPMLLGAYLFDKNRKLLYALAKSANLWERRIAIVATQYFIRQKDHADTLKIAKLLLNDQEDLIHKAVGWMLREVGKRDQSTLEGFLREHAAAMPRTALRYAIERFPESLRQAYLRGTIAQ